MEHGSDKLQSNGVEKTEASENMACDPNLEILQSDNNIEVVIDIPMEEREVSELVPVKDVDSGAKELVSNNGDTFQILVADKSCLQSENDATNDSGHLDDEHKGTPVEGRKRNAKTKTPVTSSRVLRSRMQEKPKAPNPNDTAKEGSANEEQKSRQRKKKKIKKPVADEFSRMRTHMRYLLNRIKYEQTLIDAYSGEGWKGQSLEKLKPENELQRAKSHILSYKLRIRELFQRLDTLLAEGRLPESLFDSQGEIDSEDIFCAKCRSKDLPLDNDIILCDGACERGFHQFCLEPPLLKEDVPMGDEDWLCPGCDCKVDCIDMLNDFQETNISILDSWEKIFPEAAAAASGKKMDGGSGSSSDDSEDDDFDPDKPDTVEKDEGEKSSSDESSYFSASEELAAPANNEMFMGLPSDDSEDDDFDPAVPNPDKQVEEDSSSSDFTSDSEDLGALLDDAAAPGEDSGHTSPSSDHNPSSENSKEGDSIGGRMKGQSLKAELSYLMETSNEPVARKRHVERLDYKKLHDETYGISSDSSDEDFTDTSAAKRRKKTGVTPLNKTSITKNKIDNNDECLKETPDLAKRKLRNKADRIQNVASAAGSSSTGSKKSVQNRLGEAATQRLYESFNENQYPDRAVKEKLANELGLKIQQVSKWFENARWSFRHRPQMESNATEKPPEPQPTTGAKK